MDQPTFPPASPAPLPSTSSGSALHRRTLLRVPAVAAGGVAAAGVLGTASPAEAAAGDRLVMYRNWEGPRLLRQGALDRVVVDSAGRLALAASPRLTTTLNGRAYVGGAWHSPWITESFGFTELVPSWKAETPGDSFVVIEVRGRDASGRLSSWDTVARWATGDSKVRRTSFSSQSDDLATMAVDTWKANSTAGLRGFQLRVGLYRLRGATTPSPTVTAIGAMTSRLPSTWRASAPLGIVRTLPVPQFSQMVHSGHYPSYGNGGQAWCSPTSVSMVLHYYRALPTSSAYSWVPAGHPDPWIDHAARMVYDAEYRGCGNWPFNTAYANQRVASAFVTRLRSLREAEEFIAYGIPLVASISFGRGELDGSPIGATNGHLLVIAGFTPEGDVVVNDPAAPRNSSVRRVYQRAQFERAWLPRSGGLVYVIRDAATQLPPRGTRRNW
ncbi:peptidase C39 family protein [Nocardioides sp. CPCC 205120]|uniref:peptidase C39 family protein n=1 Tax=Nocardioides sp. CPCC 205120 TaxID=3406462 RepID=UPI003B513D84